jgi:membrane protein implicated in regulation of membrane protease activity
MEAPPAGGDLMLLIVALVLFVFLPDPWNAILGLVFAVLGLGELFLWNRTVRGRRKVVGTQTLVGKTAEVRVTCRPHGQVFVDGELWEADCEAGADVGARVRIRSVDGLTLVVEPAP